MNIVRQRTGADSAYKQNLYGSGIGIAVLDSGIYPHPDFMNHGSRITAFRDFVNHRQTPYDDNGHGTHIAGIIAGSGYLSEGKYMGMAPRAHLIILKILDNKGKFCGFLSRRRLMTSRKKQVILVDHNEKSQAVNGIEEAEVQEIIDHHRLGGLETIGPVYFRNQPVGCTATIIYQMYQESGVEVEPQMAGLLCSAIISDTLLFRSPTCTMVDQAAAEALARIAGIDMEEHAKEMFNAGSNLRGKSVEEICFQDFKVFNVKDIMFGVGQITSMNQDELDEVKGRLIPYLEEARKTQGLHMLYLMMTNILEESTELLCCGENAKEQVLEAFELPGDTEKILLKGVVSRKKQMIPVLVTYLQQK